jgi:calcium/calmodulin-dependent protein kinase I
MEYLRGGELLDAICQRECYTEGNARKIVIEIASALMYMHSRKVIHRDIKPENLILENRAEDSRVKIVDFGFAAVVNEHTGKPTSYLCGTPGYMAPEIIREMSYSTAVDMWSLGVIIYILLSGTMPFDCKNETKVLVSFLFLKSIFET